VRAVVASIVYTVAVLVVSDGLALARVTDAVVVVVVLSAVRGGRTVVLGIDNEVTVGIERSLQMKCEIASGEQSEQHDQPHR
jgi:hypothetical protein